MRIVEAAPGDDALVPICAGCRRTRDAAGNWTLPVETVAARGAASYTHGICPECRVRLYPDLDA